MEWTWKGFYDSEGCYWSDEELKTESNKKCDHNWVDKPLFNLMHKMCDKCGMTFKEYQDDKNGKYVSGSDMYFD